MSIVLYGDTAHVHLAPTPVTRAGVAGILQSISEIVSKGSTSMEAGLRVGYSVADDTAPAFKGRTRLVLFTDERPNTDATDAASFMGMAVAHSKREVGLTTVGVGVQFGAELATRIGSVRGGNLYFIRDEKDVKELFTGQLDYMVSELAHDLVLTIAPRAGLRISGVYGVPGELLGWQEEKNITVTIPTVFLDNHGGGIFFTLAPESADDFLPEKSDAAARRRLGDLPGRRTGCGRRCARDLHRAQ
jgi:Ca-activated chloride channel family protein